MKLARKDLDVLRAVQQLRTPTRNALAKRCHMSTVLVSSILKDLEQGRMIERKGKKKTTGGRPSAVFRLRPRIECYAGVAVKPDRIVTVVVDAAGSLETRADRPLELSSEPGEHITNIVDQVALAVEEIHIIGEKGHAPVTVGVTVPGMVDTAGGVWLHGLQVTGIERVPLRSLLRERIGLPCMVEDWSRSVAFRELSRTSTLRDFVLLYLGVGVGSGIVINRRLYRGRDGLAGEVGHLVVERDGKRCICGSIGCLETIVSTSGILRRFRERLGEGVRSTLQQYQGDGYAELDLGAIRSAAAASDRLTIATLQEIGELLGEACSKILKILAPGKIIISGPVSLLADSLREPIRRTIAETVLGEIMVDEPIEFASYSPDDEALGAALLARDFSWNSAEVLASRLNRDR